MTELPIYPPTRTDTWDRCALLSYLENELHLVPKQADRKLVGGLAGRAFAIGTAAIHQGKTPKEAVDEATTLFHTDLTHYAKYGVSFESSIEEIVEASGIATTLPKYHAADPFKGWTIQHVEQRLPDHGRCIIDLGGLDTDGVQAVADVKYKQNLDARYEFSTIAEYQTSWQFLHYPWAYGEYVGQPCHRMYLCLVVYKPKFSVRLIPTEVHPETQQIWLASAKAKWRRMADPTAQLEMSSRHKDQFGLCSFYDACFTFHLDEGLLAQKYVVVPRRDRI
jgi:hypothetical protein